MSLKIYLSILVILLVFAKCKSDNERDIKNSSKEKGKRISDSTEDSLTSLRKYSIYENILAIPEVKELSEKISARDTANKMDVIITEKKHNGFEYYWIEVGYSRKPIFQPVYNFYLKKNNNDLLFYNTLNDSIISLKTWRSTRGW